MTSIEEELVSKVNVLVDDHQHDDLACKECKYVPATNLRQRCIRCNGQYVTLSESKKQLNNIQSFSRIAQVFGMNALMDACQFVMSK